MGSRGDSLPLRVQGRALLKCRAFNEADLAKPNLYRAPKSVPRRGTPWEGGRPTLTAPIIKKRVGIRWATARHLILAQTNLLQNLFAPLCQ